MNEPSDIELNEIVKSGEDTPVEFSDQVLVLDTGSKLLSRMITNMENPDDIIALYKPVEMVGMPNGDMYMREWLPMTDDDYIFIPASRVVTCVTPNTSMLKTYQGMIGVSNDNYVPDNTTIH